MFKINKIIKVAGSVGIAISLCNIGFSASNNKSAIRSHVLKVHKTSAYVDNMRFKRSLNNSGHLSLFWKKRPPSISFSHHGNVLNITLTKTRISDKWLHAISTKAFQTIISSIKLRRLGADLVISVHGVAPFHYQRRVLANGLEINFTDQKTSVAGFDENKKISLKFQNISVRALLQTMAQFAGLNLVVSDGVQGTISLNLKQVPWQEALNVVLLSKDLGRRLEGNILYIAPNAAIAEQDQQLAEAKKASQSVKPLLTKYIHLNYARVKDVEKTLTNSKHGFLSPRGFISIDVRTNTLIIHDTADSIAGVNAVISNIDKPVDQVLIEARIVEVSKKSAFELGLGYSAKHNGSSITILPNYTQNAGVSQSPGSTNIGLAFSGLFSGIDLGLELSALETEGEAKVVSSPHLIVSENTEAFIKQGKEIPFKESSASGASSLAFREAVLELKVKPRISPNGHIILDVNVKKDGLSADGRTGANDEPILDKKEIETKLMVKDGQTVVLGGIYEKSTVKSRSKVPLLGDIPLLGWLFSSVSNSTENKELLIFITPKIIKKEGV